MRRISSSAGGGLVIFFLLSSLLWALDMSNDYRSALAKLKLQVPEDPAAREYLGIQTSSGKMSLSQAKAEVVIIQFFSMYSLPCQRHAPAANKLYQLIDTKKEFKDRIKMIGIGMGNTQFEVGVFKERYSLVFPLFDDRDSLTADLFSGMRPPYYLVFRNKAGAEPEIIYSKPGGFTNAAEFLDAIIKASGIQAGGVQ